MQWKIMEFAKSALCSITDQVNLVPDKKDLQEYTLQFIAFLSEILQEKKLEAFQFFSKIVTLQIGKKKQHRNKYEKSSHFSSPKCAWLMGLWHHLDNYEASLQCSKSICFNELAPRFKCTLLKEVLFAVIQKEQDEMEESLQPEAAFLWKTTSTSEMESNQSNVKAETETQKGIFSLQAP